MGEIKIAGRMVKKSSVKDINGNLITLLDEEDGGYIIRNRQVVNPEKWEAYLQKERDKQEAAKAIAMQKVDANAPDRNVSPSVARENIQKANDLENKIEMMEKKQNETSEQLAQILKLLQK